MEKKTVYKVELLKMGTLVDSICLRALVSNGTDKKLTIQDLATLVKINQQDYPTITGDWKVSVDENFIAIDIKDGNDIVNLMTIQKVEVFELPNETE